MSLDQLVVRKKKGKKKIAPDLKVNVAKLTMDVVKADFPEEKHH